ncbi:MAG TPA: hypothetical protein PKC76_05205 [Saprospiraceae bacterium]|nr:hypothetical protein [Saprospiraceae bacterium]HMP23506.1 hypothetical protein [Saprospiraceae bacterium]
MSDKRLLQHPGIRLLQHAQRREQRQQLWAFSLMLTLGLVCCCFAFHNNALVTIAGLTFTVLGITALYHLYQNWNDDRLMHLIEHQPQQIVWIYAVVVQRMPFGIHFFDNGTLFFKLANGEELSVVLPVRQLKLACRTAERLLPHAAVGYSPERARQYAQNPRSLLREE